MARQPTRFGPNARGTVFEALTGRTGADISGSADAGIAAQLRAAFGVSRRDPTRPDTAAAAAGLGISTRQVQRYLRGESRPGRETGQRLARTARQAASTQRGRRAAVAGARDARTRNGARITINGKQAPVDYPDAMRQRTITMRLDPQLADGFYSAYTDRGEAGALDFLSRNSLAAYGVDNWYFQTVDQMQVRDLFE